MYKRQILKLLADRRGISQSLVKIKEENVTPVRNVEREKELLNDLRAIAEEMNLDSYYVTSVFQSIIADSVHLQHQHIQDKLNEVKKVEITKVAFLGSENSAGHLASQQYFDRKDSSCRFHSARSLTALCDAVELGTADYALLPIENTISGAMNDSYEVLLRRRPAIIAEERLHVSHSLVARKDSDLTKIKKVISGPEDIRQCSLYIDHLDADIVYSYDCGEALNKIVEASDLELAAIVNDRRAVPEGFVVLDSQIGNHKENYTRYLVIARKAIKVDGQVPCKTSMVLATGQEAGALSTVLSIFDSHSINLTKLESRPLASNPWEEMFYVDFKGNVNSDSVKSALNEITKVVRFIKVLGCYPTRDIEAVDLLESGNTKKLSAESKEKIMAPVIKTCLLYTSPSPRD